jgi:hypothetical protein
MQIVFTSYGDDGYRRAKDRIKQEAASCLWFDKIEIFSPETLSRSFRHQFSSILSQKRGGGFWIWKLDILQQAFLAGNDGDIIVYCDAGCHINESGANRFKEYLDILQDSEHGMLSFQMSYIEQTYTTEECFKALGIPSDSCIRTTGQIVGGILVAKRCDHTALILSEFHKLLTINPLIITDFYNRTQDSHFIDHRHDQSILSVLRKKHGSVILEDETQFANFGCPKSLNSPFWATRIRG